MSRWCVSQAKYSSLLKKSLGSVILFYAFLCNFTYGGEIKLFAAASLTDALTELSASFEKSHPGVTIKKSFAGSSVLAKHIDNGAPADLFISADADWVDYLQKRNKLDDESRKNLLGNALVIVAPLTSKVDISLTPTFNINTAFSGRICTGDPESVPVGRYAKQALTHYNWWTEIESRLVGADDVRKALVFVERAECGLGIVYKTDALLSKKVRVVATFPSTSHKPIACPGALTKTANADARAFWAFVQGEQAKAVFTRYGFSVMN